MGERVTSYWPYVSPVNEYPGLVLSQEVTVRVAASAVQFVAVKEPLPERIIVATYLNSVGSRAPLPGVPPPAPSSIKTSPEMVQVGTGVGVGVRVGVGVGVKGATTVRVTSLLFSLLSLTLS